MAIPNRLPSASFWQTQMVITQPFTPTFSCTFTSIWFSYVPLSNRVFLCTILFFGLRTLYIHSLLFLHLRSLHRSETPITESRREQTRKINSIRMASLLQLPVDDSVLLRLTHSNMKSFVSDVRFSQEMTVEAVKEKLWKKCGTSVDSMHLELYDDDGSKICNLNDDLRPLGFYSPQNGYRLHIIDLDPSSVTSGGWLEDTSLVEKYMISEESYNKLDSNFRKFKENMISQNAPSHQDKIPDNYLEDLCENINVGDRCEVEPGEKRGVVKFVGKAETIAPGFWVGIQLDEPLGKHDGVVKGIRYFVCPPQHGLLLRPDKVKVGNYPERDPFEEEEEEI